VLVELFEHYARHQIEQAHLDARLVLDPRPRLALEGAELPLDVEASPGDTPLVRRLRRAWTVCAAFPMRAAGISSGGPTPGITVSVAPPEEAGYGGDLLATVVVARAGGEHTEVPRALALEYLLDGDPRAFSDRIAAWKARCEAGLRAGPGLAEFVLDPPGDEADPDPCWDEYAASLPLGEDQVAARVGAALDWAEAQLRRIEPRYRELYGLPLPADLADLVALADALGQLPADPPLSYAAGAPGWSRGWAWLDAALGMRSAGILDWFAPDGMRRPIRDAANLGDLPAAAEILLDPRLDWRFRRDAPQFVTFASGNSDGSHWGLWYDSPEHPPRIAHNWARDSAETEIVETAFPPFLEGAVAEHRDAALEDLQDDPDSHPYVLGQLRALSVVERHLAALQARISRSGRAARARVSRSRSGDRDVPRCPWPRSDQAPIGSPALAMPPGTGTLAGPGLGGGPRPSLRQLQRGIRDARRELDQGHPARALGLGLYLHWRDGDDLRRQAAGLLEDAYLALGWAPFAEILRSHVLHRDLPSVSVFDEAEWPPTLPEAAQVRAALAPVQVAWDWASATVDPDRVPERAEAYARARRLGLDWDDPMQRALAAWAPDDEDRLRVLLAGAG
jgi:hypothetical protein